VKGTYLLRVSRRVAQPIQLRVATLVDPISTNVWCSVHAPLRAIRAQRRVNVVTPCDRCFAEAAQEHGFGKVAQYARDMFLIR
jgi:hypothetical protein